jgi:hypothetical protein
MRLGRRLVRLPTHLVCEPTILLLYLASDHCSKVGGGGLLSLSAWHLWCTWLRVRHGDYTASRPPRGRIPEISTGALSPTRFLKLNLRLNLRHNWPGSIRRGQIQKSEDWRKAGRQFRRKLHLRSEPLAFVRDVSLARNLKLRIGELL